MKINERSIEFKVSVAVQALACLIGTIYGFTLNASKAPLTLLNDAYATSQKFFVVWLKNGGVAVCLFLLGAFIFGFIAVYPIVYIKFFSLGYLLGVYAKNDVVTLILIILIILPSVVVQFLTVSQLSHRAFVFSLNLSCAEEKHSFEEFRAYFKNGIIYIIISTLASLYDYFLIPLLCAKCLPLLP